MSKDQVSGDYLRETKNRYLHDDEGTITLPPTERRVLITGWQEGNIADGIAERLARDPNTLTRCFTEQDLDASNIHDLITLYQYDTVIFCNGQTHLDWIEDQPFTKIAEVIFNSLTASIHGASQFVQATIDQPHRKHIVFIGSMAYNHVLNGSAPYCAAKAGLAHFAKCLAWELAPKNYDVFCVHPSNTQFTPMTEETIQGLMRYRNLTREEAEAYWAAVLPKQRWLQKQDIGEVVAQLISGKMEYMSGCQIELSGGQR